MASADALKRLTEARSTASTYSAIEASQNATNGTSDSSELPLITKGGVTRNSSVAASGCGLNRRAKESALTAAIRENTMYAAWKGTSRTSRKIAISAPRNTAFRGG